VTAGQWGLTGGAQPTFFFSKPRKTSKLLLLEAQQLKIYPQTTPSLPFYLKFTLSRNVKQFFRYVTFRLQVPASPFRGYSILMLSNPEFFFFAFFKISTGLAILPNLILFHFIDFFLL
jgi:hypothetical protein